MEKVDTKQEFGQKYPSIKRESMDGSRLGQKRKGIFDNSSPMVGYVMFQLQGLQQLKVEDRIGQ